MITLSENDTVDLIIAMAKSGYSEYAIISKLMKYGYSRAYAEILVGDYFEFYTIL